MGQEPMQGILERKWILVFVFGWLFLHGPRGYGASVGLFDSAFNLDGTISTSSSLPSSVDSSGFDFGTGLGTLKMSITGEGTHYTGLFLDHEIDEGINTFFNELGGTSGISVSGPNGTQTWEIDEPGYTVGDIYVHFLASALDNSIGLLSPDDVSMALAWNFDLAADETAVINFRVGHAAPADGFYLSQTDPDSDYTLYFSSSLEISSSAPVSAPDGGATAFLLGIGAAACFGFYKTRRSGEGLLTRI